VHISPPYLLLPSNPIWKLSKQLVDSSYYVMLIAMLIARNYDE
jgi:hypothetical protein